MAHVGLLEDNTRIAKLCTTMLQYAGHHVITFEHPRDCLEALLPAAKSLHLAAVPSLKARPHILPVDVLIMDLHLPDIAGIDVLRSLQADPLTQELPLIFCTAATTAEITAALRIAPQARFIEKPFTFQELISAVAHVLLQQRQDNE